MLNLLNAAFDAVLYPFIQAVTLVLVGAHAGLNALGVTDSAAWPLAIVTLVAVLKAALLPTVWRQVRLAHSSAAAHPELARIRRRYQGRTDQKSLLARLEDERQVRQRHGLTGAATWLPIAVQVPMMSSLYFVLRDVAAGSPIGAIGAQLASNAAGTELFGLHLASTLTATLPASPAAAAVIVGLLALTAGLGFVTQRFVLRANLHPSALEGPGAQVQAMLPAASTAGIVIAGAAVPVGLVLYWAVAAAWTLVQQLVINRFAPTPGSPAAARQ